VTSIYHKSIVIQCDYFYIADSDILLNSIG